VSQAPEIVPAAAAAELDGGLPLKLARRAEDYLGAQGVADARLEAELLLAAVLDVNRLRLYLDEDVPLTQEQAQRYRQMVERRAKGEPLQYIVGSVQFREIELGVDPRALIPRPETEVLVGVVLDWTRARARDDLRALDVGTGTGAIALSLLAEQGVAQAVATDVSAGALALAAENAARLGLAGRLELRAGSVYAAVGPDERFDVIVSNPPYIAAAERATLATEVVDWEPESALFGGVRGLDVVEPIVRGALDRLARPGLLALELAPQQTAEVAELARACGFANVRIIEDLAGRARIVAAEAG
jgi:release factor glutamine methyltransferase